MAKYEDKNLIDEFFVDFIESTTKENFISLDLLYSKFKEWYRECYCSRYHPNKKDLVSWLNKKNYLINIEKNIYGIKFQSDTALFDD